MALLTRRWPSSPREVAVGGLRQLGVPVAEHLPLRCPRQFPARWRLSTSARPAPPSPGPNCSSGRSRRTSSPARAAEAPAASSPSSFVPRRPRPSSSTSGFPPSHCPSPRPPPRPNLGSGECRPSLENPACLTTGTGVLYPQRREPPQELLPPESRRASSAQRPGLHPVCAAKPRFVLPWTYSSTL